MSLAPEPYLSACLAVIREAIIWCRYGHWHQRLSPEQTADLMDAIHNIPELMKNWERCDIEWLRSSLQYYDRKWAHSQGPSLLAIFDSAIMKNSFS